MVLFASLSNESLCVSELGQSEAGTEQKIPGISHSLLHYHSPAYVPAPLHIHLVESCQKFVRVLRKGFLWQKATPSPPSCLRWKQIMGSSDFNDMAIWSVQITSPTGFNDVMAPCTFYPTTQGLFPARERYHNYHNPSESEKVLRQLELHFFFFFCRNFQRNYFRLLPASQDFRNIDNTAFERPFRFMRHSCASQ